MNIFVKHVIFNKVVTYRFETCDFVRKCFAKICRRKFLDNLKRATAQDPGTKSSVTESFSVKLLGWTLDLQLHWKKPPPRMFICEYIRTFRASTERSAKSSAFLITFKVVYYRAAALLRRCSTIYFFLKKKKRLFKFFLNS